MGWGRPVLIISTGCVIASLGALRYPTFFAILVSIAVMMAMGWRVPSVRPLRYLSIAGISVIGVLFSQLGSDILNSEKIALHLQYPMHVARTAFYSQNIVQLDAVKQKGAIVAESDTAVVSSGESKAVAEVDAVVVAEKNYEGTDTDVTIDKGEKKPCDPRFARECLKTQRLAAAQVHNSNIRLTVQFDRDDAKKIIISLAHTVFAPYPWSTLQVGFQGNWPELFIVEGLIWMILLPFVFIYIPTILNSREVVVWLMMLTSIGLFLAYSVTAGEYSTRPRLMSMPFLWFAVSGGLVKAMSWFKSR